MCVDFSDESLYKKLTFLCPWDYDWTCNENAQGSYYAAAFSSENFVKEFGDRSHPWFIILMKQHWFQEMVKQKWTILQEMNVLEQALQEEKAYLEEYEEDLNCQNSNATKWANSVLKWIEERIEWLDNEWMFQ